MNRITLFIAAIVFAIAGQSLAIAAPRDDAVDLVNKAVALVKEVGKEKALAQFNNPKGPFVKGELYIFAYTMQGVIIAHPMNAKLIGKDMSDVKDTNGKSFTKFFIATVADAGQGWVDYNWLNPVTKEIDSKASYVAKAGDIFVGCGIYK